MNSIAPQLLSLAFAKTPAGKSVIETRNTRLSLLERRLLLLIDGSRTGEDLSHYCTGKDVTSMLQSLIDEGFIEVCRAPVASAIKPAQPAAADAPTAPASGPARSDLGLPPASERRPQELEMARNFMINTVNTVFQPNTRLSLLEAIQGCNTATELRQVYLQWEDTLSTSRIGLKRLPEFKKKLFTVL
ncbi:hypothetical protein [Ottowia beijingensis]|uniref:hypothetical protein n=1 Tax=Ottowia beijingensis TaxID=1207057 RepID=UPI002FDB2917